MPNALPLRVNLTILSKTLFIRFYVVLEVEPYENGGGRVMEERETCSGWERESREKNIPNADILIINKIIIRISALMSAFFLLLDLLKSNGLENV